MELLFLCKLIFKNLINYLTFIKREIMQTSYLRLTNLMMNLAFMNFINHIELLINYIRLSNISLCKLVLSICKTFNKLNKYSLLYLLFF